MSQLRHRLGPVLIIGETRETGFWAVRPELSASSKPNRLVQKRQVCDGSPDFWNNSPGLWESLCLLMLPPFFCQPSCESSHWRSHHQQRKLEMLRFWRDGLERQLSAVTAAMTTLEGQIQRDHSEES